MTIKELKEQCEKTIDQRGKLIFDTNNKTYQEHKLILDIIDELEFLRKDKYNVYMRSYNEAIKDYKDALISNGINSSIVRRISTQLEKTVSKHDPIYLLSIDECKNYKEKIPHINIWWWLRSYGENSWYVAYVNNSGSVSYHGDYVDHASYAVRPALCYSELKGSAIDSKDIDCFIWNDVKWKIIDKDKEIAISVLPISFDKFDDESNNYENSHIRKWLLDWYKGGER